MNKGLLAVLFSGIFALGVAGCEEEPMEEAGESVGEAAEETGEAMQEGQENIEESMESN